MLMPKTPYSLTGGNPSPIFRPGQAFTSAGSIWKERSPKYGGAGYFAITISIVSSRLCGESSSDSTEAPAVGVSSEAAA